MAVSVSALWNPHVDQGIHHHRQLRGLHHHRRIIPDSPLSITAARLALSEPFQVMHAPDQCRQPCSQRLQSIVERIQQDDTLLPCALIMCIHRLRAKYQNLAIALFLAARSKCACVLVGPGIAFVTVIAWIPGHAASYFGRASSIPGEFSPSCKLPVYPGLPKTYQPHPETSAKR